MKKRTTNKLILGGVIAVVVLSAGYYFILAPKHIQNNPAKVITDTLFGWKFPSGIKFPSTGSVGGPIAYSDIRDPGGIPQGLPVRLRIPVISVDTAIEDALITPDGRMDVPAGSVNVAWFALGPHPGQKGSAVIGGHFGISNGVPFVFYNLDKMKVGDKMYILNDKEDTLAFVVRSIKSFDRNADATEVFTSSDGLAHLNLITCEGVWNQINGNYPERLVIFADAISSEGPAPAGSAVTTGIVSSSVGSTSRDVVTFSRPLGVGDRGADVVALQTALEQRGLLELPPNMSNGFYGSLTRAAVARYQTRMGLPPVGAFGPRTMSKLNAELGGKPVLPNTGTEDNRVVSPLTSPIFFQAFRDSYATPLDGLITTLLLVAIVFMAIRIFRR